VRFEPILESSHLELVVIPASWQNYDNRFDVNNDTHVTALDVLQLINDINRSGSRRLREISSKTVMPAPFLDVTGDDHITPSDVLSVINYINAHSGSASGSGEGQQTGLQPQDIAATSVLIVSVESNETAIVVPVELVGPTTSFAWPIATTGHVHAHPPSDHSTPAVSTPSPFEHPTISRRGNPLVRRQE